MKAIIFGLVVLASILGIRIANAEENMLSKDIVPGCHYMIDSMKKEMWFGHKENQTRESYACFTATIMLISPEFGPMMGICVPENMGMKNKLDWKENISNRAKEIANYAERHIEMSYRSFFDMATDALKERYPCRK